MSAPARQLPFPDTAGRLFPAGAKASNVMTSPTTPGTASVQKPGLQGVNVVGENDGPSRVTLNARPDGLLRRTRISEATAGPTAPGLQAPPKSTNTPTQGRPHIRRCARIVSSSRNGTRPCVESGGPASRPPMINLGRRAESRSRGFPGAVVGVLIGAELGGRIELVPVRPASKMSGLLKGMGQRWRLSKRERRMITVAVNQATHARGSERGRDGGRALGRARPPAGTPASRRRTRFSQPEGS